MNELILSITIEPLEEGGYLATSDDLQGLIAQGRTIAETVEIAQDVAREADRVVRRTRRSSPAKIAEALRQPQKRTKTKIPVGFSFDPAPA